MPKWDPWSDEKKRDKDQSHKWGSYEPEEEKEKREKSLLCGINIFSFHPSTIRPSTAVMTIRNLLSLNKDFGPSLSFYWYQVEGDDRDNR